MNRFARVARIAAAVVVCVLIGVTFFQTRRPNVQLGDFGAYWRAGRLIQSGQSPYTLDKKFGVYGAYMYSPAFAWGACLPLAKLPYPWAVRVFLAVNWLATAAVVLLSLRLAGIAPGRRLLVAVISLASVGMYLWSDLHNGQVGTLILLSALGWLTMLRAGRPMLGGVVLSFAIALKIYPALLLAYPVALSIRALRDRRANALLAPRSAGVSGMTDDEPRQSRGLMEEDRPSTPNATVHAGMSVVGVVIGLAVLFIVPLPWVGFARLLPLHREWLQFCLTTQVPEQTYRAGNQSLLSLLARLPAIGDGITLFSIMKLQTLTKLYPLVALLGTGLIYLWVLLRRRSSSVFESTADIAVLLIWMTLAAPRTWTFNLAAELPAAVLLANRIVRRDTSGPLIAFAVLALFAGLFAVSFPTNNLHPPAHWSLWFQMLIDKHFIAAVVMAAAVMASPCKTSPCKPAAARCIRCATNRTTR